MSYDSQFIYFDATLRAYAADTIDDSPLLLTKNRKIKRIESEKCAKRATNTFYPNRGTDYIHMDIPNSIKIATTVCGFRTLM